MEHIGEKLLQMRHRNLANMQRHGSILDRQREQIYTPDNTQGNIHRRNLFTSDNIKQNKEHSETPISSLSDIPGPYQRCHTGIPEELASDRRNKTSDTLYSVLSHHSQTTSYQKQLVPEVATMSQSEYISFLAKYKISSKPSQPKTSETNEFQSDIENKTGVKPSNSKLKSCSLHTTSKSNSLPPAQRTQRKPTFTNVRFNTFVNDNRTSLSTQQIPSLADRINYDKYKTNEMKAQQTAPPESAVKDLSTQHNRNADEQLDNSHFKARIQRSKGILTKCQSAEITQKSNSPIRKHSRCSVRNKRSEFNNLNQQPSLVLCRSDFKQRPATQSSPLCRNISPAQSVPLRRTTTGVSIDTISKQHIYDSRKHKSNQNFRFRSSSSANLGQYSSPMKRIPNQARLSTTEGMCTCGQEVLLQQQNTHWQAPSSVKEHTECLDNDQTSVNHQTELKDIDASLCTCVTQGGDFTEPFKELSPQFQNVEKSSKGSVCATVEQPKCTCTQEPAGDHATHEQIHNRDQQQRRLRQRTAFTQTMRKSLQEVAQQTDFVQINVCTCGATHYAFSQQQNDSQSLEQIQPVQSTSTEITPEQLVCTCDREEGHSAQQSTAHEHQTQQMYDAPMNQNSHVDAGETKHSDPCTCPIGNKQQANNNHPRPKQCIHKRKIDPQPGIHGNQSNKCVYV